MVGVARKQRTGDADQTGSADDAFGALCCADDDDHTPQSGQTEGVVRHGNHDGN